MRKAVFLVSFVIGCGGAEFTGDTGGAGGLGGAGGVPGSGGSAAADASAGSAGTGGVTSTGGAAGTGGVTSTGGAAGTGGVTSAGGSAGAGGATGTGGRTGTGGAAGTGGKTGTGGSAGTGGAGGAGGGVDAGRDAGACSPACGTYRECCNGRCANLDNDVLNCGKCGNACTGANAFCGGGTCQAIPCNGLACFTGTCCGDTCCNDGMLCCESSGPISGGPVCAAPVNGTCPVGCAPLCVCASPDTPIATPAGNRAIASLGVGDLVYSIDHGQLAAVPILRVNRSPVSRHVVRRVTLATGAVLEISGGHPTADGRLFEDLRAGDTLDGVRVEAVSVVPYTHPYTHDILPASDTGAYFAAGTLIGSTLAKDARAVDSPSEPMSR